MADSATLSPRLYLHAPQPLLPESDYDTILKGSWEVETRESAAVAEWKVSFSVHCEEQKRLTKD